MSPDDGRELCKDPRLSKDPQLSKDPWPRAPQRTRDAGSLFARTRLLSRSTPPSEMPQPADQPGFLCRYGRHGMRAYLAARADVPAFYDINEKEAQPMSPMPMSPIRRLLRDRRGAIAVVFAATMPVLIGGLGLSVDTIQYTLTKRQMQRQADSAALAGAYGLAQGLVAQTVATDDLRRNAFMPLTEAPVIAEALSGTTRTVRVGLATTRDLPFSSLILSEPLRISAEAVAALVANGEFCALALEPGSIVGIDMGGNTTVDLRCGMATNSVSPTAVTASGSSQVTATPIAAVGGLQPSSNYTGPTTLIPFSVPQPDPFRNLANPSGLTAPRNGRVGSNQRATLDPGTYRGMDLQGDVTLRPGTYFIDAGDFSVGAQARVSGTGVTIIFTSATAAGNPGSIGGARVNGGAQMNLTAPTSGTYAGLLFYQDRRATAGVVNRINGNSASALRGAFYFPNQQLEFTGTSGMQIDCVQMVARRLSFRGNSTVRNICPAGSGAQSFTGTAVRLIG